MKSTKRINDIKLVRYKIVTSKQKMFAAVFSISDCSCRYLLVATTVSGLLPSFASLNNSCLL